MDDHTSTWRKILDKHKTCVPQQTVPSPFFKIKKLKTVVAKTQKTNTKFKKI